MAVIVGLSTPTRRILTARTSLQSKYIWSHRELLPLVVPFCVRRNAGNALVPISRGGGKRARSFGTGK
jgi:hypothetical protein